MGYLKPSETDLLHLPSDPEFWVRMRKKAHYGASRRSQTALIQVHTASNGNGTAEEPTTDIEVGTYMAALTVSLITEWNLTDEQERVLPISVESLDLLSDEDGEFLVAEAQKRKTLRSPGEQRPFEKPSSRPSSTTPKPDILKPAG